MAATQKRGGHFVDIKRRVLDVHHPDLLADLAATYSPAS
jgi:hypothetical protein